MNATSVSYKPQVGTAVLDGLIEGPIPPDDGAASLRQWTEFAKDLGLCFHLAIDGAAFSLLADNRPVPVAEHDNFQDRVRQVIDQLLLAIPAEDRRRVFSTVRSAEYRPGIKLHSLYVVTGQGVEVREHVEPWDEKTPDAGPRRKLTPVLVAGAIAFLVLLLSAWAVDYRALWRDFLDRHPAVSPDRIQIDVDRLGRYVQVQKVGMDHTETHLVLEIRRGQSFPTELGAYRTEEERVRKQGKLGDLLALHQLVLDGTVRVEYLDEHGSVRAATSHDVRGLLEHESVQIQVPARNCVGITGLRLGY